MAPPPWTTADEAVFLHTRIPEYQSLIPSRKYAAFWQRMQHDWFLKYPEWKRMFPEVAQRADLSQDQADKVELAMDKRIEVSHTVVSIIATEV